jgi:phosphotransferase system HPr (HPr) family protein
MIKNEIVKKVLFNHKNGMHARIAAMIIQKAGELQEKYNVEFYLKKANSEPVPVKSLMILISLKVKPGDFIDIISKGENPSEAVGEMAAFLEGDFHITDNNSINKADVVLQDNVITAEQVFKSITNGLIVIDENEFITFFNPSAEKVFKMPARLVLGKKAEEIFPELKLALVIKEKRVDIGLRHKIRNSAIVSNSAPIIVDGESKGAVCTFEDVSRIVKISWQLKEIQELKEKYRLILESVQEGICMLDKRGTINYVNPAYLRILNKTHEELIGRNIRDISPEGARRKALETGKQVLDNISIKENGVTIVANVNPIIIDNELLGVVSVVKDITEIHQLLEKLSKASAKADYLEQELIRTRRLDPAFDRIKAVSKKMNDAMATSAKAAKSAYSVLIRGESGTGKELFAEAIHYSSSRAQGPFIRVNCAAIPTTLLESELFGHEKGAFTGAVKTKLGRFELADQGTIFLDEVGEMDKSMQAKLLRVIHNKEFQRVGGEKTITADVRIIAATNQNLEELVGKGDFREDLYYRLNVIPIILPPLRERREDIPVLVDHFTNKVSRETGKKIKQIKKEAMDVLLKYKWPGNARELENVIERTITLMEGTSIEAEDLPRYLYNDTSGADVYETGSVSKDDIILTWEAYEKIIIGKALEKYKSYNKAAKALGLTHKTIATKVKKFGIEKSVEWKKVDY